MKIPFTLTNQNIFIMCLAKHYNKILLFIIKENLFRPKSVIYNKLIQGKNTFWQ